MTVAQGYSLFETAIGTCAIAWSERGVAGVALPAATATATRAVIRKRHPNAKELAPPQPIRHAIEQITALLAGGGNDLRDIELDLAGVPDFNLRAYDIARAIPPGEVLTYGDIAKRLGDVALSRAVGQAMGSNPIPIIIPCHRVMAAGHKTGGFSAPGGLTTKMQMLNIERAKVGNAPTLFEELPLAAKPQKRR